MALSLGLGIGLTRGQGGGFFNGLDLDFVANRYALNGPYSAAFPAGWSFSRTGAGTAETSGGVIVPFATGVPRITSRGLLVEEARTNLLLDSQNLNAGWARTNVTFTLNQALGPDGTMSAGLLVDNAVNGEHHATQSPSIVGSTTYTQTWIVKNLNHRYVGVGWFSAFNSIGVPARVAIFDLVLGAVSLPPTADIGAVASIRALAGGWFVLRISAPSGAGATLGTTALRLLNGNDWNTSSVTYAGTGTGIYVWNGQMEAGAFPTSPIITTGATATRGMDAARIVPFDQAGPFTVVADFDLPAQASQSVQVIAHWSQNNAQIRRIRAGSTATQLQATNQATVLDVNTGFSGATPAGRHRAAGRLQAGDTIMALNGALSLRNSPADIAPTTALNVGYNGSSLEHLNGYIRRIRILPYAASDAELQALTA